MSAPKNRGPRRGGPRRGRGQEKAGPKREAIQELRPTEDPPQVASFEEWALGEEIQRAIRAMDISVPTPIQALSIGPVLAGKDVIAKAETGTGKTLAFGAPMMARIDPARSTVLGLVLCPTRELAQQVANVLAALALPRGVKVALVVGGDPMHPQIAALQAGAQVVVGTPGRVLDLYQQRFLQFPWTEFAVLDEADKMFEIGFLDDIKKILGYLPDERQTLLFSATFPSEVLKLARAETRDPLEVATARGTATVETITQYKAELADEDRPLRLIRMIERSGPRDVFLIFCDRRTEVDRLMRRLDRMPFSVKALHGGYDQASRFRVMSAFRTGDVKALVATDVASRGLDVEHVSHVVNFSVPRDIEDYTHRIGRTGRAGRAGIAVTFVTPANRRRWRALAERMKWPVEDLPDGVRPRVHAPAHGEPAPEEPEENGAPRRRRRTRDEAAPREARRGGAAEETPREARTRRAPSRDEEPEGARPPRRRRSADDETGERAERTPRSERPEQRDPDERAEGAAPSEPKRPARRRRSAGDVPAEGGPRPARAGGAEPPQRAERPRRARRSREESAEAPREQRRRGSAEAPEPAAERAPRRERSAALGTGERSPRSRAGEKAGEKKVRKERDEAPRRPRERSRRASEGEDGGAPPRRGRSESSGFGAGL